MCIYILVFVFVISVLSFLIRLLVVLEVFFFTTQNALGRQRDLLNDTRALDMVDRIQMGPEITAGAMQGISC